MDLEADYQAFKQWVLRNSFREFQDYAENTPYLLSGKGCITIAEELIYIKDEILRGVRMQDATHYSMMIKAYKEIFGAVNADITALRLHAETNSLINLGFAYEAAQREALQALMKDPKFAVWIPEKLYKRITLSNITGRELRVGRPG